MHGYGSHKVHPVCIYLKHEWTCYYNSEPIYI